MKSSVEMVFHEELQIIFRHIAKAFGFRMSVFGPDFNEKTPGTDRPVCTYCSLIQDKLGMIDTCRESDREHCMQAGITGEIQYYTCHAGLAEAIFPLFSREKCIGYIIVGQFKSEAGIPGHILDNRETDSDLLLSAYNELSEYDAGKLESILELIRITTRYIIENRILEQKNNAVAERIIEFIEENFTDNPRIDEAAGYVKRSVSTVNSIMKEATGQSFKQYSISVRMEKGANLLLTRPDLNIQEVSSAVGLDDQFYFSRLFKQRYGVSPREYRNTHQPR